MNDDEIRIFRGPGWIGVIITSLLTSCCVLIAFLLGMQHGYLRVPAFEQSAQASSAPATADPGASAHVSVPPLLGLAVPTARELLAARGLRLVVRQKRPNAAPMDTVIAQDPLSDSMLPRNAQVVVVLSSGALPTSNVPSLAGKPLRDALKELESAGLKAADLGADAGPDRVVTGTEPAAGKAVETGSLVKLQLAAAGVELPKFTGLPLAKAKRSIADLGLKLGKLRSRYDEDSSAYMILSQTPAAGTLVAPGSSVELVYNEE